MAVIDGASTTSTRLNLAAERAIRAAGDRDKAERTASRILLVSSARLRKRLRVKIQKRG